MSTRTKSPHGTDKAKRRPLTRQLAACLMAATAVALTAHRTNASVVYTAANFNVTEVANNPAPYYIDMTGDGNNDFQIQYYYQAGANSFTYITGAGTCSGSSGNLGANAVRSFTPSNYNPDYYNNRQEALVYPSGVSVSATSPTEGFTWQAGIAPGATGCCTGMSSQVNFIGVFGGSTYCLISGDDEGYYFQGPYNASNDPDKALSVKTGTKQFTYLFTGFPSDTPTGIQYLPVQFHIGGTADSNLHYGYIKLEGVSSNSFQDFGDITILGWAYETQANTAIQTGDVGTPPPPPPTYTWISRATTGTTNWSTSGNWDLNAVPNAASDGVVFGRPGTRGTADLVAAAVTVGAMTFSGDVSTTIVATSGGSLTLDNGSSPAAIKAAGSHAINVPLTLNSNAAINVTESGGVLALGVVSGSGGIAKTGIGTLSLTQANPYGGATTLGGGTFVLSGPAGR